MFQIAGRPIGENHPCYIIAEAGVAHFGSVVVARALVDMAAEAGADAVKFQVFKTEALISAASPDWIERLRTRELPYDAFVEIKRYCDERGITFFATPHEEESADFLAQLDVPVFKIGSGEVGNLPFVRHLGEKRRPIIISTGLHDAAAIDAMLAAAKSAGCDEIALLHCVTAYPTPPDQANLRAIQWLAQRYTCPIGYSDHTEGFEIPLASVALGAKIIEKHISLDKRIPGAQDPTVSCDRRDLVAFVAAVRKVEAALGRIEKPVAAAAQPAAIWARKSLVARKTLAAGAVLRAEDMVAKRPGTGIAPDQLERVIGRALRRPVQADAVIMWEDLEGV